MGEQHADPGIVDRWALEARLEGLVRANRFTLAVTVPAVGAVLLLAGSRGLLPSDLVLHPALLLPAVLAMRLPLVAGLLPTIGRRAAVGLALLAGYAYAVEFVGVTTGWPYGAFAYTADLGPTLGGAVPLALPLLYLPLVLDSYLLGLALLGRFGGDGRRGHRDGWLADSRVVRVFAGVAVLLAVDLVLDPGAVAVGFWAYDGGGAYYGVPLSNFAGWLLTGTVAVLGVDLAFDAAALRGRIDRAPFVLDDLVSFLVLWGTVGVVAGNWLAVLVAALLAVAVANVSNFREGFGVHAVGRWASR